MIAAHSIFFEEYDRPGFKEKHGMLESLLAPAFLMKNIQEARDWANAIASSTLKIPTNLKKLVHYWKDIRHLILPHFFGGWVTIYEGGLANLFDWTGIVPELIHYGKAHALAIKKLNI